MMDDTMHVINQIQTIGIGTLLILHILTRSKISRLQDQIEGR